MPRHRPVGTFAALIAIVVTMVGLSAIRANALSLAKRHVRSVAANDLAIKRLQLTFQQAALADQHMLPIYGSSELYCCGGPNQGIRVFDNEPSGFRLFAVGQAGTADLFFAQTFGALGTDLHRKKIIISDSPPWFFSRHGLEARFYEGNFSPEIAETFIFDAPVTLRLKARVARRMLDYPATLAAQPMLNAAVHDLAEGSPLALAGYYLLYPIGRVDTWFRQLNDARMTIQYVQEHFPHADRLPSGHHRMDWPSLLAEATSATQESSADSPFGFPNASFEELRRRPDFRTALRLYCDGGTNREGKQYPYPTRWINDMVASDEWTDLGLEVDILKELGAEPLFLSLPLPGVYDDYTWAQPTARQVYYRRYSEATQGVASLSFADHDEDRYFMRDPGAHFSPRGWVFADRAVDLFWQGQSVPAIQGAMIELGAEMPAVGPPPPPWPGGSTYRWCTEISSSPPAQPSKR